MEGLQDKGCSIVHNTIEIAFGNQLGRCTHATNLLGLDRGLAAVSSVIVTEGSVVHRVTVVVPHERLQQQNGDREKRTETWIQWLQMKDLGSGGGVLLCNAWPFETLVINFLMDLIH